MPATTPLNLFIMLYNDTQLKQALAKMLPETVYFVEHGHHGPEDVESNWVYRDRYYWTATDAHVLETEWQQIALWVEEKMTDEQFEKYQTQIREGTEDTQYESSEGDLMSWTITDWRKIISAPYTTRATAMKEAGIKVL